jgi:hypothetical protein
MRSAICVRGLARPNCQTLALWLGTLGNADRFHARRRALTAFCAPGIWEYWHLFLAFAVGQLILGFIISRLLPPIKQLSLSRSPAKGGHQSFF